MTNLDSVLKSRDITDKIPSSQSYGFSSNHVWMWELDHIKSWAPKNWCFCTMVLEKTLESLLDYKEIQPVHSEGDQTWVFIGRTDAEAETTILWPTDVKKLLLRKTLLLGKIEGRRRRGWQKMRWLDDITNLMTWVWAISRNWWRTEKPGVLQSMGLQRVGHDWVTELNWTYPISNAICNCHVSPARWGSPKPQHISLVSLHPCTEVTA